MRAPTDRAIRALVTVVSLLQLFAWLGTSDLIAVSAGEAGRPVPAQRSPSLRFDRPFAYSAQAPGVWVSLSASTGTAPKKWLSASFFVDGRQIPAVTCGAAMAATWDSQGASNPSEHSLYAVAKVRDRSGQKLSLDSRRPHPEGDGKPRRFAVANVFLRRLEFQDSHPVWYSEDDTGVKGEQFIVPSSAGNPQSRPHWELITGPHGDTYRGPYELCRGMAETANLQLTTNAGGAASLRVRTRVQGALPAWPNGWHTVVATDGGRRGTATSPPLANAIDTQLMTLHTSTELGFSDGHWALHSSRQLGFTVWTDLGPHEPDPVPDEGTEQQSSNVPTTLKPFVLPLDAGAGFTRYVLHVQHNPLPNGRRIALRQAFRRPMKGADRNGYLYGASLLILPDAAGAKREVQRWLEGGRSMPLNWSKRPMTDPDMRAHEVWCSAERVKRGGAYELIVREGTLVMHFDLSHGAQALTLDEVGLIERTAQHWLREWRVNRRR